MALAMSSNVEVALLALTFLPQARLASCLQGEVSVSHETVREALEELGCVLLVLRARVAEVERERDALARGEWHSCWSETAGGPVVRKYPMGVCSMGCQHRAHGQ